MVAVAVTAKQENNNIRRHVLFLDVYNPFGSDRSNSWQLSIHRNTKFKKSLAYFQNILNNLGAIATLMSTATKASNKTEMYF